MLLRSLASTALLAGLLAPQQLDRSTGTEVGQVASERPAYTPDKRLALPAHYREWVYLTSGVDMTYNPKEQAASHSMFGNVFVNPESYRAFMTSGIWPDKTTILIENRVAIHGGAASTSLNKHGLTQSEETMGMEVHVKDATLPGGWGFFNFDSPAAAPLIPHSATCYSCHEAHAASDTTFVQFYPIILPVARSKGTLSKAYLTELGAGGK